MESPVVVDKPPEYHANNDRGFPFDEEEGSGAWSELAARHPDIAARLRQRPATWARKRRPSSQDASTDDFGENFSGFDSFPFDDIPPEFREHFPSHWNRRFSSRDDPQPQTSASPPSPTAHQHTTTATQTEQNPDPSEQQTHLPQYGLRNTVDLGQKSPADPSLVDEDDRNQRSMSAPPDSCTNQSNMSGQHHQEQQHTEQSNVRHIPIFVEGRDEPVINKSVDHGAHFNDAKPAYVPPPQPHIDREQYFADDGPVGFHHAPNFSRAFGTPFNKGFRQGPQPFTQQKAYPQAAYARGASPQRSQSPKPHPHPEEPFVKVPVHHDHSAPKTDPSRAQHHPPPQQKQAPSQPQKQTSPQPQKPQPNREQTPPPPKPQQPSMNDPITLILSIQTDVLNLMTEVENFTGSKKDKRYLFLDEMLTRNLIKLDNIETEGKENIRLARKEAIRCIQKCIAVLEAKADKGGVSQSESQHQDVEMKENGPETNENITENGEVDINKAIEQETPKADSEAPVESLVQEEKKDESKPQEEIKVANPQEENNQEAKQLDEKVELPVETKVTEPQAPDTRPEEAAEQKTETKEELKTDDNVEKKPSPKKGVKNVKKRDKSKDKKDTPKDSIKGENLEDKKPEVMQVDDKGDKIDLQTMEVECAASQ